MKKYINKIIVHITCLFVCLFFNVNLMADTVEVYHLTYQEREPGLESYEVDFYVSGNAIRIDDETDGSGYIFYDDRKKIIYSVSHHDKTVLVIKESVFTVKNDLSKPIVEYLQMADAPQIAGKDIYNYRVYVKANRGESTCTELQLAEGLLPEVAKILQRYQLVLASQQVKTLKRSTQTHTACYLIDQIYNKGLYYEKGLPIQEWHSNERSKILIGYKKIEVDKAIFSVPEDYEQYSID